MGTRVGDVDPGAMQFIMNKYGLDIDAMLNILNKKSGVLGVSGVSSDFRDLEAAAEEGNERARLALDHVRLLRGQGRGQLCGRHERRGRHQ